ncbi:MAG TPA: fluoride efflux transporter CrcB [Acidimicrobiia bacterium]
MPQDDRLDPTEQSEPRHRREPRGGHERRGGHEQRGGHEPLDPDLDPDLEEVLEQPGGGRVRASVVAVVAVGGTAGTLARYAVTRVVHVPPGSFPWSTLTVNVTGSFILGVLLTLMVHRWPPSRYARPFLAVGFLGAYTTFSTYMVDADVLVKDRHADIAALYVLASLVLGIAAVSLGIALGRRLPERAAC